MAGGDAGGHAWQGGCVWWGGHVWQGGVHGRGHALQGVHAWQGAGMTGGHAWQILRDTVNEWAIHILLECILVVTDTESTKQPKIITTTK